MGVQRWGAAVVATGALVVLAGCGGGGDGPAEATATIGPLGQYFEKVGGSYDSEEAAAQAQRSEEAVAECMADQGFEYTPMDTSQGMAVAEPMSTDNGMPAWDSIEYAQQYGYGATTWQDMPGAVTGSSGEEWVDPNQEYVDAMTDSEREAYYAALYGEPMTGSETGEVTEYDWTTAGCQGQAQHEVYDQQQQPWDDPAMQAMQKDLEAFYQSAGTDPRMADIDAEWSDCMADAGYTFDTPTEAQQSIYDQMNDVYSQSAGGTAESAGKIAPPGPDDPGMAELREVEIATATADRQCQIDVKYTQRQQEISFALEQEFVDQHKAELDAWVAKYADQD